MQLRTLTLILGVSFLAACGGDDDKNPAGPGNGGGTDVNGSFSAAVTGGLTHQFTGEAGFASVNDDEQRAFLLALSTPDDEENNVGAFIFSRENHAIPGNGQYVISGDAETATENEFLVMGVIEDAQNGYLCGATGGTLNVTSSAATRVRGNFEMTMECVELGASEEILVEVSGTFDSRGGAAIPTVAVKRVESAWRAR